MATKHGHKSGGKSSHSYAIWRGMKLRCYVKGEFGIAQDTLWYRVSRGWSLEDAVTIKPKLGQIIYA